MCLCMYESVGGCVCVCCVCINVCVYVINNNDYY